MIINVFAVIQMLTKQFKTALMPNRDIYNSIAIIIALDQYRITSRLKHQEYLEPVIRLLTKSSKYLVLLKLKTSANRPSVLLITQQYHLEGLKEATTIIQKENKRSTSINNITIVLNQNTLVETMTSQTDRHSQTEKHSWVNDTIVV